MDANTSSGSSEESKVEAARSAPVQASPGKIRRWVARFGVAGFLFFLIKGMMWLIVPALVVALR